jgi:hypothetical protein
MGISTRERGRNEVFEDMFQNGESTKQEYDSLMVSIDLMRMKMQCMKLYLETDFISEGDRGFYVRDIESIDGRLEDLSNMLTADYEAYIIN